VTLINYSILNILLHNKILTISAEHLKKKHETVISLRKQVKDLTKKVDTLQKGKESLVELVQGSGLCIPMACLTKIRATSKSKSTLARNLFRYFFTDDVLLKHSLYGKFQGANKNCEKLPPIDAKTRDIIFGK
jgi:hypothetical protein